MKPSAEEVAKVLDPQWWDGSASGLANGDKVRRMSLEAAQRVLSAFDVRFKDERTGESPSGPEPD